jgi:tRNA pseudouridine38-40 synthase
MPRYFLEVAYKGTAYKGFQIQINANSIQQEVQKALQTLLKEEIALTGSSRTDAGVHAYQNFFHFDTHLNLHQKLLYNLNAILPTDIVAKNIIPVSSNAHCRFDAISREYEYHIYTSKNPFLEDRAFYFPFKINFDLLQQAADVIKQYNDFTSFSKRNTQVKTFICNIMRSEWSYRNELPVYNIQSNRFLRGMVRGVTATMLKVGREQLSIEELHQIIQQKDCTKADFSAPPQGLFLTAVNYPPSYFFSPL